MPCGKQLTSGTSIQQTPHLTKPNINSTPHRSLDMQLTEPQTSSEMTGDHAAANDFVEQEETSIMESPKWESSEWTNEKHSLYLKSMEDSFVNQLYNCWQPQNECSSDSMSTRKLHARTCYPSGQFKVQQHGFWSRIDFKRENLVVNEARTPHVSSANPWIQHFTNGGRHEAARNLPPREKLSLTAKPQRFSVSDSQLCCQQTSCSDTEVTDQNFVEDSVVEKVNKRCSKKRKSSAVSKAGNDEVVC